MQEILQEVDKRNKEERKIDILNKLSLIIKGKNYSDMDIVFKSFVNKNEFKLLKLYISGNDYDYCKSLGIVPSSEFASFSRKAYDSAESYFQNKEDKNSLTRIFPKGTAAKLKRIGIQNIQDLCNYDYVLKETKGITEDTYREISEICKENGIYLLGEDIQSLNVSFTVTDPVIATFLAFKAKKKGMDSSSYIKMLLEKCSNMVMN